jgi:large subunit ribosomal protein L25
MTQVFNIEISDGTTALALPKAIHRDPIKDTFEHVDLLIVRRGEKVTVEVPVRLVGEAARDTLVMTDHDTIAVLADATRLPDHLEASIEGLNPGERVTAGEIVLPDGVELAADPAMVIAMVAVSPTAEALEGVTAAEEREEPEEVEPEVAVQEPANAGAEA